MLNKGQLGILSPKRIYLGWEEGGERIAFPYVCRCGRCAHTPQEEAEKPFLQRGKGGYEEGLLQP